MYPKQDFDIQQRITARGAKRSGVKVGQLKVGPTHQVAARVPATNGESWTSVFLSCKLGKCTQKHVDKIYILHVGKTRRWCDRIISSRTNECIRVTVSLLALDIPVTRHQDLLHHACFSSQCYSFSKPDGELSGTTIMVLRLSF